ncbi:MAG: class I mannose-6-phosphate isomerase [Caldilineales bacterium]|nr:class I mannose-6-phosphate isomerase [Caldilineales bacterium]MDW8318877.1 class I mannose-6-phosphate isomerase [Anaerolineae bacterium]
MTTPLYPMTFTPVLKDYVWGGRNLETRLGRRLPPEGVIAESWEIAAHEDGTSTVDNGPLAGQPLTAVHAALGLDLIGRRNAWAQARGKFPLLIKLLDAATPLSVQVHPDDAYALAHEGNELGKTEMWVVLHAEPGAELILGVKAGATREAFRRAIEENRLEPFLHRVPVRAGDHVCVPAGTLHAIMGGLLIAEIQQNSNTTYRVYDWGRVGKDGKPRPLHVDKALDVINFALVEPGVCPPILLHQEPGLRRELLCRNRYFTTERVTLAAGRSFVGACDGETLEIWGAIAGQATVNGVALAAVRFCLLPAALGPYTVTAGEDATLLRTYVEESADGPARPGAP